MPHAVGAGSEVRLSEVLGGLSFALDLTEGQRPGHAARSCLIGMRIGEVLGLDQEQRASLFYALIMKDLGCSSNAARFAALFGADDQRLKANLKTVDWSHALESFRYVANNVAPGAFWLRRVWQALAVLSHGAEGAREVVQTRCERGADISRLLQLSDETTRAIRALDEHWDGGGQPYGLQGSGIPLLGRIIGLAQTVEVFYSAHGEQAACDVATARRGTWFDPELVNAFLSIRADGSLWHLLGEGDALGKIRAMEPPDSVMVADNDRLDLVAEAFARVVDAKSPWTYRHSHGVADIATSIGRSLGFSEQGLRDLRRAALLHDLGKLGVSNLILDKPGKLTDEEFVVLRQHPAQTEQILNRVGCLRPLADIAASHHERLDGNGYHRRLSDKALSMSARVLCAADICDALRQARPYRASLPPDRVLEIMGRDAGTGIDRECFAAVEIALSSGDSGVDAVPPAQIVPSLAEDHHQAA
jgi:putative nucleotidyltransferase with HDIG domain